MVVFFFLLFFPSFFFYRAQSINTLMTCIVGVWIFVLVYEYTRTHVE